MPLNVPQGLHVGGREPVDDRIIFDTPADALAGIAAPRRYDGLAVWIKSEGKTYRFMGGTANDNFTPEPSSDGSGGDSALTAPVDVTVAVGGLKVGDVLPVGTDMTTVCQKILNPAQAPAITAFTATPAFGLKETGVAIPSIALSANIAKRTSTIQTVKIIQLPDVDIFEETQLPDGGVVTYTDSNGIDTGTRTYRITVTDVAGLTASTTGTYEFVNPMYIGSVADTVSATTITEAIVKAMTKRVVKPGNQSMSYTITNEKFVVWVPDTWAALKDVIDPNGFGMLSSFDSAPLSIQNAGGATVAGTVYVLKLPTSQTVFNVTYRFV